MANLLTGEEVRKIFREEGVTVTAWARKHGFSALTVYSVLSGRTQGLRGEAHQIAVALGMKPRSQGRVNSFEPDSGSSVFSGARQSRRNGGTA